MKSTFADIDKMIEVLPPLVEFLDRPQHNKALAEMGNEARSFPTVEGREKYLSEPWKAPSGCPMVLNGKPRVVAWVALQSVLAMTRIRNKMISSDWDYKHRMSYDSHFYNDLIKVGIKTDLEILEDLMVCFQTAAQEARDESQVGGRRWAANRLLGTHLRESGLFTYSRAGGNRIILWEPLRPLLAVAGLGEMSQIHPSSPGVSIAPMV